MKSLKTIDYLMFLSVLLLSTGMGFLVFNQYQVFVVQSGSMEPSIPTGSLVLIKPQPNYVQNDVVTFRDLDSGGTVTHRIVKINATSTQFQTKGDANSSFDKDLIFPEQILGKVTHQVPYLGYPLGLVKSFF